MRRNVFVSGGTGTIGEAIVRAFHSEGHNVEFSYCRDIEKSASLCDELGISSFQVDFRRGFACPTINPEILINNAGINESAHGILETSDEEIYDSVTVNVMAAVRYARIYLPAMEAARYGRIININSVHSIKVPAGRLSYGMGKLALRAFTQSVAQEVAAYGITVNEICPGPVDSALLRGVARRLTERGEARSPQQYIEELKDKMPMKRLIHPDEVAFAALYFASDLAAACTGQSLVIDGALH